MKSSFRALRRHQTRVPMELRSRLLLMLSRPRFAKPAGEQTQPGRNVDDSRGNPHDEPTKLLIFQGRQPPRFGRGNVSRVPCASSEGEERAQKAAVERRGEHITDSHSVAQRSTG